MTFKVGIAGCGIVGKRRYDIIKKWDGFEVVAVSDKNQAFLDAITEDIPKEDSYPKLLEHDLDIVFVCLPNHIAADATIISLKKGCHVFCEKPPGRSAQELEEVIRISNENPHLKLKYGFNHRYHESVQAAMELIQNKKYGDIVNVRGVYGKSKIVPFEGGWRSERQYAGGGILLDQGIHMLDLMRLFCGEFTEVKSFISNDYWGHDVEDNAFAIMKTEDGRLASIHSSATLWDHKFELHITCREGYITLSGILTGSKSYGEEKLETGYRNEKITGAATCEVTQYINDPSWSQEIDEFFTAVQEDKPILHGLKEDAHNTMSLIERIYSEDKAWADKYYPNESS